jgi:hypothetical protein
VFTVGIGIIDEDHEVLCVAPLTDRGELRNDGLSAEAAWPTMMRPSP